MNPCNFCGKETSDTMTLPDYEGVRINVPVCEDCQNAISDGLLVID